MTREPRARVFSPLSTERHTASERFTFLRPATKQQQFFVCKKWNRSVEENSSRRNNRLRARSSFEVKSRELFRKRRPQKRENGETRLAESDAGTLRGTPHSFSFFFNPARCVRTGHYDINVKMRVRKFVARRESFYTLPVSRPYICARNAPAA